VAQRFWSHYADRVNDTSDLPRENPTTSTKTSPTWLRKWPIALIAVITAIVVAVVYATGLIPGFGPRILPAREGTLLTATQGHGDGLSKVKISKVKPLTDVTSMALGAPGNRLVVHGGEVYSWGDSNDSGQLGHGSISPVDVPTRIEDLPTIVAVSAGLVDAYALDEDGQVWGWGQYLPVPEAYSARDSLTPIPIPGLPEISQLVSSEYATYALDTTGTVWGWGTDVERLLGYEEDSGRLPSQIPGIENITSLATGGHVTLALQQDGTVWVWGYSPHGDLGLGDIDNQSIPAQIPDLHDVRQVERGLATSYALDGQGYVYCWGSTELGQCGQPTSTMEEGDTGYFTSPVKVPGIESAQHLVVTDSMAYAWTSPGLWAWGTGWGGSLLVDSHPPTLLAPTALPELKSITGIFTDESTTFLLAGSW